MSTTKPTIATVWLDGCSGCHMSFLDMDERLIELAGKVDLVYSPLVDLKDYPESVDLALVEGAVSSEEDEHKIRMIRERTKTLVSFGDCAVTSNVPSMRNVYSVEEIVNAGYGSADQAHRPGVRPHAGAPLLRPHAQPVHEVVKVDLFLPGCPPPADAIYYFLTELLEGRKPDPTALTRFGK